MADLKILGPVELRGDEGRLAHSFLAGPKRLALLTFLVLNRPRGFQRRDRILPLLWPDKGQKSARNSLSNLLYHIRKSLGGDIIEARGTEEIGINYDMLQCDALDFEKALNEDKTEIAVELYRGNLLEGFYVGNTSPDIAQWLDRERERFRNKYIEALEILALQAENAGDLKKAAEYWEMQIQADPFDTSAVKKNIALLTALGKRGEALKKAESHAAFLLKELDLDRDKILDELISEVDQNAEKIKASGPKKAIASSTHNFKSVAILPLEEFGDNEHIENFASGLHNDLLTRLSAVSDLTVISRTSVLRYRKTKKTIAAIANEIGAGSIVEGSVQIIGDRVRLNIQLIDVGNDYHIWADTYDRKLTAKHLFDIQSELALKITEGLRAKLMPVEKKRIADWAPTNDLEAHRLYTYGRRQVDQRTENGMKRAVEYFQEAVQKDPGYAQAWAGLTDALILQYDYGYKNAKIILPKAEKAIRRALELDPNLAEAHASMGLLYSNRHEGGAAIRELKKAVELQPSYAEAHNWLSWNYQLLGNAVNALESAKTAVNLNPLSPESVSNLSVSYLYNGYPEKALSEALRAVELQPDWGTPAFYQGLALLDLERYSEAKSVLKGLSAPWAGNGPLTTLALCHIMTDDIDAAEKIQAELREKGDIFSTGLIHAALGDTDQALELFQWVEFWDDWETLTIHHLYTDILGPLKKDPRYKQIRNKVYKSRGSENVKVRNNSEPDQKAIAVLPFTDYMNRDELSPFAEGIQNDLITKLSRVDDLTIISGDSMRRLSFEEVSIEEIALKLGVGTVIKGGVQQIVGRIRLTIQLMDATTEQIRWAETYDRELTAENLFNIQSELAEKIAGSLRAELTSTEKSFVGERPTKNLAAYLLYTQGRSYLSQRTEQSIFKSLNLFRDAVKKDPEYANAWAGLAEALLLIKWYKYSTKDELRDPMEAIQKALELNPELGETYCSLGIYHSYYQNGPEAINALEKCIELQPGYSEAYNWLGWVRMIMGDAAGGLKPVERAARLDPLSPYTRVYLAVVYLANNKYQEALEESKSARKIQPEFGLSHFVEGLSLYHLEKYSEAEFSLNESLKLESSNGSPFKNEAYATLALAKAANGSLKEAQKLLDKIKNNKDYFCAGLVEAALNNYEEAHNLFEKVEKFGAFTTPMCRYYFPDVLNPVRNDSRFNALILKLNKSWNM
jgi:TolB-like protein/Flp pilus assembly protein TadD